MGSVISYQCDDGFMFEQQDQIVIQCVQKNWNVTDAACEGIDVCCWGRGGGGRCHKCEIFFCWRHFIVNLFITIIIL